MLQFIEKFFGGNRNAKEVSKLEPLVAEINEYAEEFKSLSDEELQGKTAEFKGEIREAVAEIEAEQADIKRRLKGTVNAGGDGQSAELSFDERTDLLGQLDDLAKEWITTVGQTLNELLPEAFAVVKETCRRMRGKQWEAGGATVTWDMVPYDVQLLGGIVLHQGRIAEMKTGEGKTLVAVAPVYLNALAGRGVHVVTVNPYLAQRDSEWMGPIFGFLGLTTACINNHDSHTPGRREAYRADITYGTNNEFGFDYLRDNSFVIEENQLVQRGHHFAIVDEVDSVLVDEARTPLIISGPVPNADEGRYKELKPSVERLVNAQKRLVATYVSDAERLMKKRDAELEAGNRKEASKAEEELGLALLRAQHGFSRNRKLFKLKQEPGIEQLIQRTENFYLQDNARNMPFVDEELYFVLNEKQRALEMTDKGRKLIADAAGTDADFFIIPDIGDETARMEGEQQQRRQAIQANSALSEDGRMEQLTEIANAFENEKRELYALYDERTERIHSVNQLLKAYMLFEKDVEYIVQDGKVQIVDEHTGRVLSGRRYSDGLHQAIEAKENVKVERATQTYATVTLQNYFRLYSKLSGMTGTAETEAGEFYEIYKLDVVVVPTNRPIAREDLEDLVFRTKREKYKAVIDQIRGYHEGDQPVLVGTTSVEVSETLSRMLKREGIPHNVLNAKADRAKSEAMIVAEAGRPGAVTIATNMAGRGTDIKLAEGVRENGGLAILGTERHESRRIDLQLRGRSGRQGDPGASQFYVSLEDNLMRLFGSDRSARIMDKLGMEEGEVITHKFITKGIERAQKKVEQNNFGIRKRQLEYDDVLNAQREVIYDRRMHALKGDRLRSDILNMVRQAIDEIVQTHYGNGDLDLIQDEVLRLLAFDFEMDRDTFAQLGEEGMVDRVYDAAAQHYAKKRASLAQPFYNTVQQIIANNETPPERVVVDFTDSRKLLRSVVQVEDVVSSEGEAVNDGLERVAVLSTIDDLWVDHLRELDELKQGIGLRGYGQKDPLLEYKMEAFKLFEALMDTIARQVAGLVFKAGPLVKSNDAQKNRPPARGRVSGRRMDQSRAQASKSTATDYGVQLATEGNKPQQRQDPTAKKQPVVITQRVGLNDPCPCGSGKKYKKCHGRPGMGGLPIGGL